MDNNNGQNITGAPAAQSAAAPAGINMAAAGISNAAGPSANISSTSPQGANTLAPAATAPMPAAAAPMPSSTTPMPAMPVQFAAAAANMPPAQTSPAAAMQPPTTAGEQASPPAPEKAQPACNCPMPNPADWDHKKKILAKMFFKTFSPKLFYFPFSYAIDVQRAKMAAQKQGYTIPAHAMILDKSGMFWGSILIEVEGAEGGAKNIVDLTKTEVETRISTKEWKQIRTDVMDFTKEIGQPKELYLWYTACPKCLSSREVKTILIAVPGEKSAGAPASEAAPATPQSEQPASQAQPPQA